MLKKSMYLDILLGSSKFFQEELIFMAKLFSKQKTHSIVIFFLKNSQEFNWILIDIQAKKLQLAEFEKSMTMYIFSKRDDLTVFSCLISGGAVHVARNRIGPNLTLQTLDTLGRWGTGLPPNCRFCKYSSKTGFFLIVFKDTEDHPQQGSTILTLLVDESGPEPTIKKFLLFCQINPNIYRANKFFFKNNSVYCNWFEITTYNQIRKFHLRTAKTQALPVDSPFVESLDVADTWAVVISKQKQLWAVNSHSRKKTSKVALDLNCEEFFKEKYWWRRVKQVKHSVYVAEQSAISQFDIRNGLLRFVRSVKVYTAWYVLDEFHVNLLQDNLLRILHNPPVESHFVDDHSSRTAVDSGCVRKDQAQVALQFDCTNTLNSQIYFDFCHFDEQSNSLFLLMSLEPLNDQNFEGTLDLHVTLDGLEFRSRVTFVPNTVQNDANHETNDDADDHKSIYIFFRIDTAARSVMHCVFRSGFTIEILGVGNHVTHFKCKTTQSKQSNLKHFPNWKFTTNCLKRYKPETQCALYGILCFRPLWLPCPLELNVDASGVPRLPGNPVNSSRPHAGGQCRLGSPTHHPLWTLPAGRQRVSSQHRSSRSAVCDWYVEVQPVIACAREFC